MLGFTIKIDPSTLHGPWNDGIALDVHTLDSKYIGDDAYGHPQFETTRTPVGELLYRLKYQSERSAAVVLCETAANVIQARGWNATIVIPVPPSRPGRRFQPVPLLAKGIAELLGCSVGYDCVNKVKETPELKTIYDYGERLKHLADAYTVAVEKTRDQDVLLVDDLYRSGATLEAITNTLHSKGKTRKVFVITITRTRSNR